MFRCLLDFAHLEKIVPILYVVAGRHDGFSDLFSRVLDSAPELNESGSTISSPDLIGHADLSCFDAGVEGGDEVGGFFDLGQVPGTVNRLQSAARKLT